MKTSLPQSDLKSNDNSPKGNSVIGSTSVYFLMPTIGQPRIAKRIDMLIDEGFDVKAYAFEREYHQGRLPKCTIQTLGNISKGQYIKRLGILTRTIPSFRRITRDASVIYAFGLDLALLALLSNLFRKTPVVIEAGDIRPVQVARGIKGRIIKWFSQYIYNRCSLLVVTADEFVSGYYNDKNKSDTPYQVIENKLDMVAPEGTNEVAATSLGTYKRDDAVQSNPSGLVTDDIADLRSGKLTIGYFGLLRSPWSFLTLERYAKKNTETVRIIVAGALHEGKEEFAKLVALKNVEYLGPYRSPEDLRNLYEQVDLVWGCYPEPTPQNKSDDSNWLWAQAVCRSNRFYESCYYRVPIVSMGVSSDGKVVAKHQLGPVLKTHDFDEIEQQLDSSRPEQLKTWRHNLRNLPASIYIYTDESAELATRACNSDCWSSVSEAAGQ